MLKLGRTDLLLLSELVGWHGIHQTFPGEHRSYATLETPYDVVPSWLMATSVSPESDRLLERFDDAFHELENAGRFDALIERYTHRPESSDSPRRAGHTRSRPRPVTDR